MEAKMKVLEDRLNDLERREKYAKERGRQTSEMQMSDVEQISSGWASVSLHEKPEVIKLNVCGKRFEISLNTLLKYKGSFFQSQRLDPNEELFIERDPKLFRYVLSFLVSNTLTPPSDVTQQLALEMEFKYFNIPYPLLIRYPSSDFNQTGDLIVGYLNVLKAWFPTQKIQLIYKATKNGFTITDFSRMCSHRGPTLTVIRSSTGFIFGGFTPLPWTPFPLPPYYAHPEMFIFTLFNPHNIPPTRFYIKSGEPVGIQMSANGMMPKFSFGAKGALDSLLRRRA
eukprot:Phypoly_transcript_12302.p1 GENE.Phypoly_transcript_12302~~Phypoly_transcript_12302.p1  ORF type:complete len:304 (+),score=42.08 Phypoly_transcript_12302:65-913(+)